MRSRLLTMCVLSCLTAVALAQPYSYRCWFDNSLSNAVSNTTTGETTFNVDVSQLSAGFHALHVEAWNSNGRSSVQTRYFLKDDTHNSTKARYWFDSDPSTLHDNVAASGTINLDISTLSVGLHTVHYQTFSADGRASAVHFRYFLKEQFDKQQLSSRVWIDDDTENAVTQELTDEPVLIDLVELEGNHILHVELYDDATSLISDQTQSFAYLVDGHTYNNNTDMLLERIFNSRTFNNTNWQALYLPFSLEYSDWSGNFEIARINDVHQFDDDEDGTLDRTMLEVVKLKAGSKTEPNTPYVIKPNATGTQTLSASNTTLCKAEEKEYDVSSWFTLFTFGGTYSPVSASDPKILGCMAMSGGVLRPMAANSTLGSYRWYLMVTDRNGNAKEINEVKLRVLDENGTVIEEVEFSPNSPERAGDVYDLSGRRVQTDKARNGVYIVNGRKVLIK